MTTTFQRTDETLRNWSPTHAPALWIVLNGICCVGSALIFLSATFLHDPAVQDETKEFYIVYGLVSCLIWFLEAGFYIRYGDNKSATWTHWLELVAAGYFVVDCAVTAYRWSLPEIQAWEIYLDSCVDFIFYVYFLVLAIRAHVRREEEDSEQLPINIESGSLGAGYVQIDESGLVPYSQLEQQRPIKTGAVEIV